MASANYAPRWRAGVLVSTVAVCSLAVAATRLHAQETAAALRDKAMDLAYNLDHDEALVLLRRALALAPDDPATNRSIANVLWLNMLFNRGAVTVDHYLGSFTKSNVDLKKPPPELDAEFRKCVRHAIELAERAVAEHPDDPQAHYDLGAAVALQASYVATVEGKAFAGFKAARQSYDEHEKVLKLDPSRKDAGLIVGTYRYVVSTLSLPMRMMAYVVGFGGGRERGIQMLQETAAARGTNRTDALFALVLVYNRERRYDDALKSLEELRRMYPRNRLVLLEAGATALRGKRYKQADDLLTQGLAMFAADKRAKIPGEEALWKYKRGAARVGLGRPDAAVEDLRRAVAPDGLAWVQGRAHVELGRVAFGRGERDKAAAEARQAETLCEQGRDPACLEDARTLLRNANGR